jgi:hypothetical protein
VATGRVHAVRLADTPVPAARGRVHRISGTGSVEVPRGRVHRISSSGAPAAAPRGRVHRVRSSGVAALAVEPIAGQQVPGGALVALTASLEGGQVADSWAWRRISGPAIGIEGTGATRTFRAPSIMPPANQTVVVGVTATVGGVTSVERTVEIVVMPQLKWFWTGAAWVGSRPPG